MRINGCGRECFHRKEARLHTYCPSPCYVAIAMSDRLVLAANEGDIHKIRRLIEQEGVDPRTCTVKYLGWNVLHISCRKGYLHVVKYLIETSLCDPMCLDEDGRTPLHLACNKNRMEIVKYLIQTCHCDPMCVDNFGWTPLHHACECDNYQGNMEVVKYLVETAHCDAMFVDKSGLTPLHRACDRGHTRVVRCLLETAHCDPVCVDRNGLTPLHHACDRGHIEIVRYLIETAHWDPMIMDDDGRTPLHHACHIEVVKYLLIKCCIDPNCKDIHGNTPLDLAVNKYPSIVRELVKAGANATARPTETPVKVFIVGNPSVGKSSLTKALQTETSALGAALASITGPRLVSDVEQKTAGIVPCHFTSKKYGRVTFYDFAGQQEYYASHAAMLQNYISFSTPLFIIVVNLSDSEEDINQILIYWLSLLANQCTSVSIKPNVIIVGSHSDVVRSIGKDPRAKVDIKLLQSAPISSCFHISKFISMDCRQSNSHSIVNLAKSMKEIFDTLRKQVDVAYHLYKLFTYLLENFNDVSSISFEQVLSLASPASKSSSTAIPTAVEKPEYLHSSCKKLHDTGHLVYIDNPNVKKRWIILDQSALISEVNGVLFAPEGFKQHCNLANATGVVLVSRLTQRFPQHDPDMLVQFLTHFEFCCEITDHKVLQLIIQECPAKIYGADSSSVEHYLFFPGLVSIEAPHGVWETNQKQSSLCCGWTLQCSEVGNYLTSRFLQVTLLRVAFSCALALENPLSLTLKRRCSIWKNGIYWGIESGVEALMEVRYPPQNREVVVMLRCESGQEVECAHLRSTIIKMVLEAKDKLCPVVPTKEFFLHPSQVREYPCKSPSNQNLFSFFDVAKIIEKGKDFFVTDFGVPVNIIDILLFEPYAKLGATILQELFSDKTSHLLLSDRIIYMIAEQIYDQKENYIKVLKPSQSQLDEKIRQAPPGRCEEFVCVLQCWRGDSGTCQSLRETLDQFSVFAGRNPLDLPCT